LSQSPLIVKYEKALADDPRSRAFAPLAEAYRKVGLLDKAFEVLKKGIRYNPDYIMGYFSLSQCYYEKGEFALAYTTLRPISAKNRDNIKLQKLYGEVCCETENYEEALDTFKYLLFLNPRDAEISNKVQKLESMLSESAVLHGADEVTFEIDELSASPENDRALDDWVQVDLSRQVDEEAQGPQNILPRNDEEDWYEATAVTSDKDAQDSEDFSLEEVVSESEPAESPVLEDLKEIDDTPVITHTLVDLYLNQGHKQKAIEILEKIIKIQPDNKESVERLALLKGPDATSLTDESVDDPSARKDEGHSKLSAVLDQALGDEDLMPANFEQVDEVLSDFLSLLRDKSSEFTFKR
jgi:tetratricopeptide (TPR) repeat protein